MNAVNAFAAYRLLLKRDPQRHRLTGGITLSLGTSKLQTDIRINYERYVYRHDTLPPVSERNKAVIEFMCHF